MNKLFTTVQTKRPPSSTFDLSHDLKFSFNMGEIVPTTVMEVIPGDSVSLGFENMLRFGALISPVMHKIKVSTHYFFVPNRILWPNWEEFITGNETPPHPYFKPHNTGSNNVIQKGSLADYMGIPTLTSTDQETEYLPEINAFPFAAYWRIMHEYYMDQNNTDEADRDQLKAYSELVDGDNTGDGDGGTAFGAVNCIPALFTRAWNHDYFTSALPFAQKGDSVRLPIGELPVGIANPDTNVQMRSVSGGGIEPNGVMEINDGRWQNARDATGVRNNVVPSNLVATPDEGSFGTITNLRRAFRLQEWLEKNARGGTRYNESVKAHFGIISSDARLQRPEYIGGSTQNMIISEVLSTAETLNSTNDVTNPVGALSGHGISVGGSKSMRYRAEEHGFIIGVVSVMPETAYQQGLARKFTKLDKFDYPWPSFATIGEQEIKNQEIYLDFTDDENQDTFGYIPRYMEYKFENNRIAGDFRDTLDFWHLGRQFENRPSLNRDFIYPSQDPNSSPFDRIFAVSSTVTDTIYAHVFNKVKVNRMLPKYGIPTI